jgi:hypothetical protein
MYAQFTDRARKVMQLANQEAQRFRHEYIGTEHILLGLIKEGSGVAANVLKNLEIDLPNVRREVEKLIRSGPYMVATDRPQQTSLAKKVIFCAMEEARNLKHNYVGTEHILLGLLREQEGVAAQVLMNLGLRLDQVRAEVYSLLGYSPDLARVGRSRQSAPQKAAVELPQACPKCGHAPVVRVIWGSVHLFGKNLEDIAAGRAILGSRPGGEGPPWVCLKCTPAWSEVHTLAMRDYELQVVKEKMIAEQEFDKAAQCRDAQDQLRRRSTSLVAELLRNQETP